VSVFGAPGTQELFVMALRPPLAGAVTIEKVSSQVSASLPDS
jgi:hypothetical protein